MYKDDPDEIRTIGGRPHFVYHDRAVPSGVRSPVVRVRQAPRSLSHRAYAMGWAASCSCGQETVLPTYEGAVAHGCAHIAAEHPFRP